MSTTDASTNHDGELERLRTDVERLRRQVSAEKAARSRRVRAGVGWVLTVLAVLVTTLALLAIWTFRTFTDSDLFVDRIGSIIEEPEVAAAVGDKAAAELVDALELEDRLSEALPPEVSVVAAPLTTAAENYLAQATTRLVESDQFQQVWDAALRQGHALSIAVLSGSDAEAIANLDGVVVLDLTPVINALLAEGSQFLSELLGREISAPTVTEENLDAAIAALEDRLDVDLPADFGQVVLFEAPNLAAAQQAYQSARTAVWLAPLGAALLIGLAVAVSPRRLRTGLWIVVGTALALLVVAITLQPIQSSLLDRVADESLSEAVAATFDTVFGSLLRGILLVVILGVLAAATLFLAGGSHAAELGRDTLRMAPSLAATHRMAFLVGGAVVGLLLLAVIPGRDWGQIAVVLLLYAGYALVVLFAPHPGDPAPHEPALPGTSHRAPE